ncbi:hypothetical protein HHI36_009325 [Cryptolaemus montrouzieri]|uniref:ABC transporter domain-containing protein n=1 Tax=Cryptolaemus montrouzieri TaxID=559131 RepID=A0ABD2MVD5_9CUCU
MSWKNTYRYHLLTNSSIFVNMMNDIHINIGEYGLLGASGCGKTTLLNCIVGRNYLNSGEIWVLGGRPGTVQSGVPGRKVGYMPQEVALCDEFTVKDAVFFFGKVAGMSASTIQSRFEELKQLLDLPPENRFVKNCSGGQQRRISFASALIHKPELLILDEPTAGVDPLLRESIWGFLIELTQTDKTTVIITTHYIEETRKADMIGLMRGGQLLAEAPPNTLLQQFRADSLEDVFFSLSRIQEDGKAGSFISIPDKSCDLNMTDVSDGCGTESTLERSKTISSPKSSDKEKLQSGFAINTDRMAALLDKNWKEFHRNISGCIFMLLILPILCSALFVLVIGSQIKDFRVAVVNEDSSCEGVWLNRTVVPYIDNGSCHMQNLGCRFGKELDDDPLFIRFPVQTIPEAVEGFRRGLYMAILILPKNHSIASEKRLISGRNASDEILESSMIKVQVDMSDYVVGSTLKYKLVSLYRKYLDSVLKECNYLNYIDRHLRFQSIYGSDEIVLTEDMIPGYFLTLITYIATLLTTSIIISERIGGIWDRSAVAGVTTVEIILSHFVLQFCVMLVQIVETYLVMFFFYGVRVVGSLWLVALFAVLQGIVGIVYGFLVSIMSFENYFTANAMIAGGFYPMVLICGILWPMESQPEVLQWVSKATPFAFPAESLRNVLRKGWDLSNFYVLKGTGVQVIWIVILTSVCVYMLKKKQ